MFAKVVLSFTGRSTTPVECGLFIAARPTVEGFRDGLHEAWMEMNNNGTLLIEVDASLLDHLTKQQLNAALAPLAAIRRRGGEVRLVSSAPPELERFFNQGDALEL
jgi:hypothetical protein